MMQILICLVRFYCFCVFWLSFVKNLILRSKIKCQIKFKDSVVKETATGEVPLIPGFVMQRDSKCSYSDK